MSIRKSLGWAVALTAMALPMAARAESVSYITSGVFSINNSAEYSDLAHGIDIAYTSSGSQVADLSHGPSQANFGTFDTSLTTNTASNTPIGGTFTLSIFQITPDPGPNNSISFVGTLAGTLFVSASQSYVQFNPSALTGSIGDIFYSIVSADGNHPGRVNLNPQTTQGGISNINGGIAARAVPEPSTLVLMGLGVPALLAARYRREKNSDVAA